MQGQFFAVISNRSIDIIQSTFLVAGAEDQMSVLLQLTQSRGFIQHQSCLVGWHWVGNRVMADMFEVFLIELLDHLLEELERDESLAFAVLFELDHDVLLSHLFDLEDLGELTELHEFAKTHEFTLSLDVVESWIAAQICLLAAVKVEQFLQPISDGFAVG